MTSTPTPVTKSRRRATRRSFGSIRQLSSGRYQARYTAPDGTEHTAPTTFTKKSDADNWLATNQADLARGTWRDPDAGSITLASYLADWIDSRPSIRPATRHNYRVAADRWIMRDLVRPQTGPRPARTLNLGTYELRHLTPAVIRDWFATADAVQRAEVIDRRRGAELRKRARQTHGDARAWARQNGFNVSERDGRLPDAVLVAWRKAGSPKRPDPVVTLDREHVAAVVTAAYRTLRACLNTAVRDGLIVANPCNIPRAGDSPAVERTPASPAEVVALSAAMPEHLAAAVHVAAWSGLRAGELFGLTREHVDLDPEQLRGTVRVTRALVDIAGQPLRFGPPKTPASLRTVALPPHVVTILAEHLDKFTGPAPDALLFSHPDGTPVNREDRTRLFGRARRIAGRPDLRWHDLRHTGATLAAQAGATLRELQHRFGHSTADAAMRYQHATAERDREIAERLSALAEAYTAPNVHHLPTRRGIA